MLITLPRLYTEDALNRELDIGRPIEFTERTITLDCSPEQLEELESDADYYSETQGFYQEIYPICYSAKAALKRIQGIKQGQARDAGKPR